MPAQRAPAFARRSVSKGRLARSRAVSMVRGGARIGGAARLIAAGCLLFLSSEGRAELPNGFVYLSDIDPGIGQDIRYYGSHNFVGRRIDGYNAPECILTREAALALSRVQAALRKENLSLIVWDCYRPARAAADFVRWSKDPSEAGMKAEFFPRTDKASLFALGYISAHSAHSRGSTVDLGLMRKGSSPATAFDPAAPLPACNAPKKERFEDGALDMGTGYDCLDQSASIGNKRLGRDALQNRMRLRGAMIAGGFRPYDKEWWHFELRNEPFRGKSFDFPIEAKKH